MCSTVSPNREQVPVFRGTSSVHTLAKLMWFLNPPQNGMFQIMEGLRAAHQHYLMLDTH